MSQSITRTGIDLAKNVFQVCTTDAAGKVLSNRQVSRKQLPAHIANTPTCEIVMEACGSAHYWARVFERMGHTVKLIHPAYVKPYIKTNKHDAANAEALCEAASRPQMRFVRTKTLEQQDIQALHRIRGRLVSQRTRLGNQIRGLPGGYGLVIPQGIRFVRQQLPGMLEDADNELTPIARESFQQLYEELVDLDRRVEQTKRRIE